MARSVRVDVCVYRGLLFSIASGTATISCTMIKEVNPDHLKASTTGVMNFLVFVFLNPIVELHRWDCVVALLTFFLREAGAAVSCASLMVPRQASQMAGASLCL